MLRDDRVFLMGEDVGRYGGCYAVTKGLLAEFGPERIRDTPLSEGAFVGAGIGAALGGMRPIVEVMTVNFSLLALDQIVNNAATIRHMSGGQFAVPVVIRMATGAGRQLAAQHSHTLEGWYAHVPGLKVVTPATIEDARGMLSAALADPNPVIIFEHVMLYAVAGKLPAVPTQVSLTGAAVRREGRDITLITYGGSLPKTLAAADALASEGISAEVIDLRCLRPLDTATIVRSVSRTRRAVIVDEGWRSGSFSAEVAARLMEDAFWELDAPVGRVCSEEVPIPYPRHLEEAALPQAAEDRIGRAPGPRTLTDVAMGEFVMPSLGADMEAGILVEWLKRPGDAVRRGDIVAVVETDKGAIEVEIFEDAIIDRLLVDVGTKVPVGTPLASLRTMGQAASVAPATAAPPGAAAPAKEQAPHAPPASAAIAPPAAKPAGIPPAGARDAAARIAGCPADCARARRSISPASSEADPAERLLARMSRRRQAPRSRDRPNAA